MKCGKETTVRRGSRPATWLAIAVVCLGGMAGRAHQEIPVAGSMTDFSALEYFDAPHQRQVKSRISGAQTQSLPGGLLLMKQVRIEKFGLDGKLQIVVEAPECIYDPLNGVANSPGQLHLRTGDGQLRINGEGFLWRQSDSFLTISNRTITVIEKAAAIAR